MNRIALGASVVVLVAGCATSRGSGGAAAQGQRLNADPSGDPGRYIGNGNHPLDLVCDVDKPVYSNVGSWSCRRANADDLARAKRGEEEAGTKTIIGGKFAGADNKPLDLVCDTDRVTGSNRTTWVCRAVRPWDVDRNQRDSIKDELLDLQRRSTSRQGN